MRYRHKGPRDDERARSLTLHSKWIHLSSFQKLLNSVSKQTFLMAIIYLTIHEYDASITSFSNPLTFRDYKMISIFLDDLDSRRFSGASAPFFSSSSLGKNPKAAE